MKYISAVHYIMSKMSTIPDHPTDPVELPTAERLDFALQHWKDNKETVSIQATAKKFGVAYSTLEERTKGAISRQKKDAGQQKLSPQEEAQIVKQVEELCAWGWPPLVSEVRRMAMELLQEKGEKPFIHINWPQDFLTRNPTLRTRFVPPLDKERQKAACENQIRRYFELYRTTKIAFNIHDHDVYNMDEKGVMMGVMAKMRVVCPRRLNKVYTTQAGSREWVSMIECIQSTGRVLTPWIIFKAKMHQKQWYQHFPEGHIAISDRG